MLLLELDFLPFFLALLLSMTLRAGATLLNFTLVDVGPTAFTETAER